MKSKIDLAYLLVLYTLMDYSGSKVEVRNTTDQVYAHNMVSSRALCIEIIFFRLGFRNTRRPLATLSMGGCRVGDVPYLDRELCSPRSSGQTPLVCYTAPQQADAVAFANEIAGIVDNSLKLGSFLFQDPAKRAQYNDVTSRVITALKDGWSAPGICDAIANSIADPLRIIPFPGPPIADQLKPLILAACQARKTQLGC